MSRRVVCPLPSWSADKKCRNHPWHVHCGGGYECIYRKQNFDIPTEFISTTLWDCINISMGPNLAQSMFCHVVDRFGLFHWSSENKQFWVETGDHRESLLITLSSGLARAGNDRGLCQPRDQVWAIIRAPPGILEEDIWTVSDKRMMLKIKDE